MSRIGPTPARSGARKATAATSRNQGTARGAVAGSAAGEVGSWGPGSAGDAASASRRGSISADGLTGSS